MQDIEFDYRGVGHINFTMTLTKNQIAPPLWKCVLKHLIRIIYYQIHRTSVLPSDEELLFVSQSTNNERTLLPITKYLSKKNWRFIRISDFPTSLIYRYSLKAWPGLMRFYRSCNEEEKKRIRLKFRDFGIAKGCYDVYINYLKGCKKLCTIIVANDHTIRTRALIEAAREVGIPVIYTQHASVTDKFPPLHFAYSFLDGRESYEKYKNIGGIEGRVILLGSPRFDDVINKRNAIHNLTRNAIGVGLNKMDSLERALETCVFLKGCTNKEIIVRPHPATMAYFDQSFFTKHGISISNSKAESSYDFFTKINVLIANESGIHLDAAIFGIPSILYNFSENPITDWYGYLRNGVTQLARTPEELKAMLDSIQPINDAIVQYYYAAFHSKFDGSVARTIAAFLDYTCDNGNGETFLSECFREQEPGVYSI